MFAKTLVAVAALSLASIGTAGAATVITHDPVGSYFDGTNLVAYNLNPFDSREIIGNATDGIVSTFFSLGIDGGLKINVAPDTFGPAATVIEVTNGAPNANYPESAEVYFDGVLAGEIFNNGTATGPIVAAIITDGATFAITIPAGVSLLTLLDTTFDNYEATYRTASRANDGFDVSEVTFSVVPIPVPAAALLFGSALVGMGLLARRRRKPQAVAAL